VSVAACLLLFSFVVLAVGPPVLRRLTHTGDSPRLGVAAWMTAIASVLVSWAAATMFTLADLVHHWNHPGSVLAHCLATLRGLAVGKAGTALQLGLLVLVGLGAVAVTISAARLVRMLMRMRNQTHGHASAVHLVGRRQTGLDAVIIDAPEPAAYCIAGRPHAVVITSAALATLTKPQLEAILAHERAHLDGRHPEIVAVARSLAKTFPGLRLMAEGAHHISRLLEMCADDAAAREHGRQPILDGILALTGATPVPSGAMGAAGIAVLDRAERLADARDAGVGRSALTAAVIAMTAGGPLAAVLLAASGTLMCGF
jgi:beta-lactamase regulating signal transducer with metallopeptidase domain